jgi:hypothetical protein
VLLIAYAIAIGVGNVTPSSPCKVVSTGETPSLLLGEVGIEIVLVHPDWDGSVVHAEYVIGVWLVWLNERSLGSVKGVGVVVDRVEDCAHGVDV